VGTRFRLDGIERELEIEPTKFGFDLYGRVSTTEVGRTNAGPNGSFSSVEITVPEQYRKFAPQQFYVVADGQSSIKSARAPFMVSG
jgi:hypothetical protein